MNRPYKKIHVVAAVIIHEENYTKKVFATQRGYGEYKDWWEFPGGKVETGETLQDALVREIKEELAANINVGDCLTTVEYDYPAFHLSMDCFICELESDNVTLIEHEAARWLAPDELRSVKWLPADIEIVNMLERIIR